MALGVGLYLIPIAIISTPTLIELKDVPLKALVSFLKALIALWLIVDALISPRTLMRRILSALGGGILLLIPLTW